MCPAQKMHDLHLAEYFALEDDDLLQNAFSCAVQTDCAVLKESKTSLSLMEQKRQSFLLNPFVEAVRDVT
jgi:hypothetical protein